ncbi:unnamed protein product, partial [Prorocentrum cordatum]
WFSLMGAQSALIETFQSAGIRALELLALRQSLISAVPQCPAVSLACPPANVSCPVQVCPALACPTPACPVPLVDLSCPPAGAELVPDGLDILSACWGYLAGASAGLGLGGALWRRGGRVDAEATGVGDRAREQLQLIRLVTGVSIGDPGLVSTYSPDGDHYAEYTTSDDLRDVQWSGAQGATPPGVNPAHVYRFRQVPTAAEVQQLIREGSLLIGGVAPPAAAVPAAAAAPVAAPPAAAAPQGAIVPRGAGVVGGVPRAGAAAAPAVAGTVWLAIEDFQGVRRCEQMPDPLPQGAVVHGELALVPHGGGFVGARQVALADVDAFVVDDLRVLPVRFNQQGARRRPYSEAVDMQIVDEPEGGIMLQGPRTTDWVLRSYRDAGLTPVTHHSNWLRRRLAHRRQTEQCANDVIAGLNALHSPCEQRGPVTAAQRLATATILNEVKMAPKSDTHFSRRGAAKELLASSLSYTAGEAPSPVVRYVRSRVDIPEVGAVTPPVESVLDGIGRSYVLDYEQAMMKTPDEWSRVLDSEPPVTPYMDEVLKRDPVAYRTFIGDLVKANMLGFTHRPKDLVTPFFVAKKSGAQRLVWDARVPNRRFRDPPPLAMGTSAAYGRLQLPDDRKEDGSFNTKLFCAQADVRNYFYALGLREELGLFFSLPPVVEATDVFTSLGRLIDGASGRVFSRPERSERLRQASLWLEQRPRVTGGEVERYVGHLIDHLMLKRELLSILRSLYDFVRECYHVRARLWPSAAREVEQCRRLLPLMSANLRLQWSPTVFAYDACLTGMATCQTTLSSDLVKRIGSVSERWRYRMPSAISARRSALGVRSGGYEASEGPFDVFSDIETAKAPKSTSMDLIKDPWELNPQFTEVPVQALQGPQWKQVVSARVHVKVPRLPRAASVKRPAASPKIAQKSFLKGRPFVGATKEERIAHRLRASGPFTMVGEDERGFLEWNAVAPETQACYKGALDDFQTFVDLFELPLHAAAQVDLALMNYADYAWSIGLERAAVLKTYAAYISAHPDFSRKGSLRLPRFCRALQGWRRLGPGQTRPPMPWQVVALVALAMATQLGSPRAALMVVTMFWVYLRPSEAVGLREQDLFLPSGSRTDCGFNLRPSARGERSNASLSDESLLLDSVDVPWLGPLLARARSGGPQAPLFRLTAAQLGVMWRQALELAEVPAKCVPYQLRHGGPSHDRLKRYRSMGEIKRRGRWASDYTMKRYEAHALVQQEPAALPVDVRRRAEAAPAKLHAELERLLARPQRPFVELMRGSAALAKAVHAAGWASEGWGYAGDPRADLLDESLVDSLVLRISRKEVAGVHVGLDCKTWSRARKNDGQGPPPLRDDANLHGLPLLAAADAEKVRIANRLLANVLRLLAAAVEAGVPFSLENPRTSRLWLVPKLLDMARDAHAEWASVDYCQYQ